MMWKRLAQLLVMLGLVAVLAACPAAAGQEKEGVEGTSTVTPLQTGKVMESEVQGKIPEPNFGYVGQLGSFAVSRNGHSGGLIVVHHYPDTKKSAMGHTKLSYEGAIRLGNVNGWVYKTQWDGKIYPSKVFFSADKIYFGAGINAYICADYREGTGWAWKLLPMRRLPQVAATSTTGATGSARSGDEK
jgi:hypothetical protein